jgi:hypothetical protein
MATVQLNVRVEAELAGWLKREAMRLHANPGALVAQALEQFLSGASGVSAALAAPSKEWQAPLAALEARVAKLEAKPAATPPPSPPTASPERVKPAPPVEPAKIPQMGDGAITTADLAIATGTNRAAWNNWARDKNPGAIRKMKPEVGNWRYLGKAPSEMGGPERGLWEPA